jgi:hypothetical protein
MLYKLNLEGGKFYFGMTDNLEMELMKHHNGQVGWTRENRVLGYEISEGSEFDLIHYVLLFMSQYGYNNVRGGYWQQTEPYKNPPPVLMRFIKGKSRYNRLDKDGDIIM